MRADLTDEELAEITARLDRLGPGVPPRSVDEDGAEPHRGEPGGPRPGPGRPAGQETLPVERDVRELEELGLTEGLEVGHRLPARTGVPGRGWDGMNGTGMNGDEEVPEELLELLAEEASGWACPECGYRDPISCALTCPGCDARRLPPEPPE
ncbi:hypothetical protein [Pseudonocardia thermophila]|uniref:hypothetical protein n=1 Tax=Pseudonocardia thermophila TaxID=1848 RepID=UPI00248DD673|nr:hypothetical protein [Pseudonocardia thermophila]